MAFASTQIGTPYYMSPELFKNKVRRALRCGHVVTWSGAGD